MPPWSKFVSPVVPPNVPMSRLMVCGPLPKSAEKSNTADCPVAPGAPPMALIVPAVAPVVPKSTVVEPKVVGVPPAVVAGAVKVRFHEPAVPAGVQFRSTTWALPRASYTWACPANVPAGSGLGGRLADSVTSRVATGLDTSWLIWIGADTSSLGCLRCSIPSATKTANRSASATATGA